VINKKSRIDERGAHSQTKSKRDIWFKRISWAITTCLVVAMIAVTMVHAYYPQALAGKSHLTTQSSTSGINSALANSNPGSTLLPEFNPSLVLDAIAPIADFHTIAPTRPRETALNYTVTLGDSIFGIAKKFNIKPDTVLWANYDTLKDDPDMLPSEWSLSFLLRMESIISGRMEIL